MDKYRQAQQFKQQEDRVFKGETILEQQAEVTVECRCPNCGARVGSGMMFCEECGARLGANSCRHCHATIEPRTVLCKECGKPLAADKCTFCGNRIPAGVRFCPECGNPRDGIACSKCGTLNFRSFCRRCNEPLNEMAREEIKRAQADPRFQRAMQIAEQLAELEQKIRELQGNNLNIESMTAPSQLSDDALNILAQYRNLIASVGAVTPVENKDEVPMPTEKKTSLPQNKTNPKHDEKGCGIDDMMEQYRLLTEKIQEELTAMIPEPKATPEQKRNFFCARKVTLTSTQKVTRKTPVCWICNLCGCQHRQPSECARPDLGGQWIYNSFTEEKKIHKSTTVYV